MIRQYRAMSFRRPLGPWRFTLDAAHEDAIDAGDAWYCDRYRVTFLAGYTRIQSREVDEDRVVVRVPMGMAV